MIYRFTVPTCLQILEQHHSVISSSAACFSNKAAVSKAAKAATHNQPLTTAHCEPQDLYAGSREVTKDSHRQAVPGVPLPPFEIEP